MTDVCTVYEEDGSGDLTISPHDTLNCLTLDYCDMVNEFASFSVYNREAVTEMVKYMQAWLNTGESNG